MTIPDYEYTVEQCDVAPAHRTRLVEYRVFRRKCLEYMRGDTDSSVMRQLRALAWQTAVFRTLTEARKLEPQRVVNGALGDLIVSGYASLMSLGIRRLVDRDARTNSIWNVIEQVRRRPGLVTRETFVCFDGLPYDYARVQQEQQLRTAASGDGAVFHRMPTRGPDGWVTSQILHRAFDRLSGSRDKRERTDEIQPAILDGLTAKLSHQSIRAICRFANQRVAHAEHIPDPARVPQITYSNVDEALRNIVRVAHYLSANVLYDAAFVSVVPTPQYDVLKGLDEPWVATENLPALRERWHSVCDAINKWDDDTSVSADAPAS